MIHEVEGDILLTKAAAIAHGVAANDPMNQGLAAALHERYPAMHKDFHHWCRQHHPKVGSAWFWSGANGVRIGFKSKSRPVLSGVQRFISAPNRVLFMIAPCGR